MAGPTDDGMAATGGGDDWIAIDKAEHFLACFSITLFISTAAALSRRPLLRHWSTVVGSIAGLLAGALKEFADYLLTSASAKDAAADVAGVIIALVSISVLRCFNHRRRRPRQLKDESEQIGDVVSIV